MADLDSIFDPARLRSLWDRTEEAAAEEEAAEAAETKASVAARDALVVIDRFETNARQSLAIAVRLAEGAQPAIRHTKLALNNWLRLAGPSFDASLALEFLDMAGPDVHEGVAAVREKRPPQFS